MARPKSIAEKNALKGTIPTLTLGTFVRAGPCGEPAGRHGSVSLEFSV